MFSKPENQEMHPSALRLLECAKVATEAGSAPISSFTDLIRVMQVSSGLMTNWKRRGVSTGGALQAQDLFGVSSSYILRGDEPKWVSGGPVRKDGSGAPSHGGKMLGDVTRAGSSSLTAIDPIGTKLVSAPVVAWADLKAVLMKSNREWPIDGRVKFLSVAPKVSDKIKALVVEESRLPTISAGDCIAIDPDCPPWDDCVILVQFMTGKTELRRFRSLASGDWEAIAPGEPPLDSARHGLKLVAVVVGLNKLRF